MKKEFYDDEVKKQGETSKKKDDETRALLKSEIQTASQIAMQATSGDTVKKESNKKKIMEEIRKKKAELEEIKKDEERKIKQEIEKLRDEKNQADMLSEKKLKEIAEKEETIRRIFKPHNRPKFWPENQNMPRHYMVNVQPCPKCRRVLMDDGGRAVSRKAKVRNMSYLRCRVCGYEWKMLNL